jgi:hypothetical protein
MHTEDAKPKVEAAFRRRFPSAGEIRFTIPQPGYIRVSEPVTGAWTDYDISAWRIRALAWNAPSPSDD